MSIKVNVNTGVRGAITLVGLLLLILDLTGLADGLGFPGLLMMVLP
ncbi:MAG: hypothetical protein ACE5OZ_06165 [Candidatus Heimdallarchaeota archaeon]